MVEVKITQKQNAGDYSTETTFEAKDIDNLNENLIKGLFVGREVGQAEQPEIKPRQAWVITEQPGVKHDVVAIYDNAGIPSIMHRFTKTTNKELFGGSEKTHPAFILDGVEYDEIYISVYPNCEINGKPYSLPYQKPWTNITNDDAAKACFSKGEGWHLLTAAEWGLLADTSLMLGTLPHGNTNGGKYHADPEEHGEEYDNSSKTLTGSGPATWTHDHTPEGVHDLCGNVWEMVRGLRIKNGVLQAAKDNDAALDIDLTQEGDGWQPITDDSADKKPIRVSVNYDGISLITNGEARADYSGGCWEDIDIECESEQLKELALFPGEPEAYFYVDSTDGEYFPFRGGNWDHGALAGVFATDLYHSRAGVFHYLGFRSAYFKKN